MILDGEEGGPGTIEEADALLTTTTPDVEEPAAEPAAPASQPRDEAGRFAKAPEAEAPAEPEAAPPPETPSEPVAATEPAVEEQPEPEVPFTFRADGREISIPGSDTGPDGVFIPSQHIPEIQNILAEGMAARGSVRQRLSEAAQQVQAEKQRADASEARSQQILAHIEGLVEQSQTAFSSGDVNAILQSPLGQWLYGVTTNWPVLKAQAQAKAVEMQNAAERKQLEDYRRREAEAQLRPMKQQTLQSALRQFGQGLDAGVLQALERELGDPSMDGSVFVRAPYDDPASGIKAGEVVIDFNVVQRAVNIAKLSRPSAPVAAPAPKVMPAVKPPPTIGRGTQAPSRNAMPAFKTAKEADDWLLEGELPDVE